MKLDSLIALIGYDFADDSLLRVALTHRSAGPDHNERLEFLGDAVLDVVISEALYDRAPEASEGDLSRLRASLVRRESLANLAGSLALSDYLVMGAGEHRSGGHQRDSTMADALEAVIGAVYLDGGLPAAEKLVKKLFAERLENLPNPAELRDPKTRLQERLQARGHGRPEYDLINTSGEAHARRFEVRCRVPHAGIEVAAEGRSRRRAEQRAAAAALAKLRATDD